MNIIINRKGLTARELVLMIILIVSFVILLMVILFYPWGGTIDKEACHNSIVMRSTFNLGPIEAGKSLPLKCRTEKICVTMSGKDCMGMPASTKDNPVTKINVKTKGDVMQVLANAIYDCNAMLGEGKMNFMPTTQGWSDKKYCLICSRVAFDEKIKQSVSSISYVEFYQAMEKMKIPDGRSYLEAVYGVKSEKQMEPLLNMIKDEIINKDPKFGIQINDINELKINLADVKGFAIVASVTPVSQFGKTVSAIGTGGMVAGILIFGGLLLAPITGTTSLSLTGIGIAMAAGGTAAGVQYYATYADGIKNYGIPTIYSYDAGTLSSMSCYSFETAP